MSDDEDVHSEEESMPPQDEGPSEAELAMQRRRAQNVNVDDDSAELLETNRKEREAMEQEIQELRERSERRKKERVEEEQRRNAAQAEEDQRRRAEEEERKRKRDEEEGERREERQKKLADFEKYKNNTSPNFVITKRSGALPKEGGDEDSTEPKKSKEQLEAEKKAILEQRIQKLETSGFTAAQFAEKAREMHHLIHRAESEKYDLEKRYKEQQMDMIELAEKARNMNTNKKSAGALKRAQADTADKIQERFAGAPLKVMMYSKYERQKDKRSYDERFSVFTGPVYAPPIERINPLKNVVFDEGTGLPSYVDIPGAVPPEEAEE